VNLTARDYAANWYWILLFSVCLYLVIVGIQLSGYRHRMMSLVKVAFGVECSLVMVAVLCLFTVDVSYSMALLVTARYLMMAVAGTLVACATMGWWSTLRSRGGERVEGRGSADA